jgi:hypothetical protein
MSIFRGLMRLCRRDNEQALSDKNYVLSPGVALYSDDVKIF